MQKLTWHLRISVPKMTQKLAPSDSTWEQGCFSQLSQTTHWTTYISSKRSTLQSVTVNSTDRIDPCFNRIGLASSFGFECFKFIRVNFIGRTFITVRHQSHRGMDLLSCRIIPLRWWNIHFSWRLSVMNFIQSELSSYQKYQTFCQTTWSFES